eukprot:gene40444-53470_t
MIGARGFRRSAVNALHTVNKGSVITSRLASSSVRSYVKSIGIRYGSKSNILGSTISSAKPMRFIQNRAMSTFLDKYNAEAQERGKQLIPPKPLDAKGTSELVALLKNPPKGEENVLLDLLVNRVPPGVDEAAYVKAAFLTAIAKGETTSPLISPDYATALLGTMQGGYNIVTLVELLDHPKLAKMAADKLCHTLLMFEAFFDVEAKAKAGNAEAKRVIKSWAEAEWFLSKPEVPKKITVTVFKISTILNVQLYSLEQDNGMQDGLKDIHIVY